MAALVVVDVLLLAPDELAEPLVMVGLEAMVAMVDCIEVVVAESEPEPDAFLGGMVPQFSFLACWHFSWTSN